MIKKLLIIFGAIVAAIVIVSLILSNRGPNVDAKAELITLLDQASQNTINTDSFIRDSTPYTFSQESTTSRYATYTDKTSFVVVNGTVLFFNSYMRSRGPATIDCYQDYVKDSINNCKCTNYNGSISDCEPRDLSSLLTIPSIIEKLKLEVPGWDNVTKVGDCFAMKTRGRESKVCFGGWMVIDYNSYLDSAGTVNTFSWHYDYPGYSKTAY